jgi:hypothetical protein
MFNIQQDRQCTDDGNIEARSRNHCYRGTAVSIKYCECVSVALVIQHESAFAVLYCHL